MAAKVAAKETSSGCFDLCRVGAAVAITPDNVSLKRIGRDDLDRVVATD